MKKRTLAIIVLVVAAAATLLFQFYKHAGSDYQAYEQSLSSGDIEAANRRLAELKAQYDKDSAKISELGALKEVHISKARDFVARCEDLPTEQALKSMVFAQRIFMMEVRKLRSAYLELSYNTLSAIESAIRNWKRHSIVVTDSYNQLIYYAKLHSEKDGASAEDREKWDKIEDDAWALQATHEELFSRGMEELRNADVLQAKFQKNTEERMGEVMRKTLFWKIEPLFSPTALRYVKAGLKNIRSSGAGIWDAMAKNTYGIAVSMSKYMATTFYRQTIAFAVALLFFALFTAIARYIEAFRKKIPDNGEKTIVLFELFLKKRSKAISLIIYLFTAEKLTLFPYPEVHFVMASLWMLLPIWCVLGAVDVTLPACEKKAIFGIFTDEARCRARRAFLIVLWTQMIGWELIVISRIYNLGFPYGEAVVSAAMNVTVFAALWLFVLRGIDASFRVPAAKEARWIKPAAGFFAAIFGILALLGIFGYLNISMWISYNIWATAAVAAGGYLILASATVVLAQKWFPELLEFRRTGVSRLAFFGLSASGLYGKHKGSDLRMLVVHTIDFLLAAATTFMVLAMTALVWDFKWGWLGKLASLPCMPYIKGCVPTVGDVFASVLILYVTYWLSRNVKTILTRIIFEPIKYPEAHQYTTTLLINYVLWTIGAVAALGNLDISWGKVQWLIAAIGVGVGFGLQEIVSNFICGLILLFERPIKVNDYISLDQLNGVVDNIQIRSTTIRTFNNISVIVPNKDLITKQIVNLTYNDDVIRLNIPIDVPDGSDVAEVKRTLLDAANGNPHVLRNPAPNVILKDFGDKGISFVLRAHIDNARNDLIIQSDLNDEIKRQFDAKGIKMSNTQYDITLHNADGK